MISSFCLGQPWTSILLIYTSQVPGITGMDYYTSYKLILSTVFTFYSMSLVTIAIKSLIIIVKFKKFLKEEKIGQIILVLIWKK
jgi:hypothetical protein